MAERWQCKRRLQEDHSTHCTKATFWMSPMETSVYDIFEIGFKVFEKTL